MFLNYKLRKHSLSLESEIQTSISKPLYYALAHSYFSTRGPIIILCKIVVLYSARTRERRDVICFGPNRCCGSLENIFFNLLHFSYVHLFRLARRQRREKFLNLRPDENDWDFDLIQCCIICIILMVVAVVIVIYSPAAYFWQHHVQVVSNFLMEMLVRYKVADD